MLGRRLLTCIGRPPPALRRDALRGYRLPPLFLQQDWLIQQTEPRLLLLAGSDRRGAAVLLLQGFDHDEQVCSLSVMSWSRWQEA